MAKVVPKRNRPTSERNTNWLLIGGVIAVGLIGLFALLFLALQNPGEVAEEEPELVTDTVLEEFCEENEANCFERGEEDAAVTVVEVSDYLCPHCRNFNLNEVAAIESEFIEPGSVEWVILPFALGPDRIGGAEAALCAGEQDAFFEFHQGLFEIQDTELANTREGFVEVAEGLDLDAGAFEACIDDDRFEQVVSDNIVLANQAGVSATPTFFVNGVPIEGNRAAALRQQIATALAEADS